MKTELCLINIKNVTKIPTIYLTVPTVYQKVDTGKELEAILRKKLNLLKVRNSFTIFDSLTSN
jgi:hypothetical protein